MELPSFSTESIELKYICIICIIIVLMVVLYNFKQNREKLTEADVAIAEDFEDTVEEFNNI